MTKVQNSATQKRAAFAAQNGQVFSSLQEMVTTAVFIALAFVVTTYINLRIPFIPANGGLVHLGNVPVFVAAAIVGKRSGALTGAVGLGLFDLLNGWTAWAPFTFVVCGLIGLTYGWISEKKNSVMFQILAVFSAILIKVAGYYVAEGILYGNWIAPVASVPGNIVQITAAGIIALPVIMTIRKALPALGGK